MPPWVLSPIAVRELEDILAHIAHESGSVEVAQRVLADFRKAFDLLATTPYMGHEREALTGKGPRWWRIHSYLAIYDPEATPLRILRIVHTARDLDALFGQEH